MIGRSWTLVYRGGRPPTVNAARRQHPHQRARDDRRWRAAFAALAREQRIPPLDAITVDATPLHADRRSPQDTAACAPAAKAAVDGLVDAKVIPDDGPRHVHRVTFHAPHVCDVDGLRLVVTEDTP